MHYLMLGRDRTVSEAARTMEGADGTMGRNEGLLRRWCQKWNWVYRCAAYEEHFLLLRLESLAADRDSMYERQKEIADSALNIVGVGFEQLQLRLSAAIDSGSLEEVVKPDALSRLLDIATKVQRLAIIGRMEAAEAAAERDEKIAETYAADMANLAKELMADLEVPQEKAQELLAKHLLAVGREA